jgi:phenylalanyl-tRNA synthetase beta chain
MKIVLSWLREFVPLTAQPREIADDLTMLGLAVESLTQEQGETVFELDITTNRPDCLNHYGVARELAAHYGLPLAPVFGPPSELEPRPRSRGKRKDGIVEIEAVDLCLRYSGLGEKEAGALRRSFRQQYRRRYELYLVGLWSSIARF